jgi:T4 RnlA family RNA ligase
MDLSKLQEYIDKELVVYQTHPTLPLRIFNYSRTCQYEGAWDELTLQCRGLILDDRNEIVARPFKKFFNIEERKHTPTEDFEVFEKLDGSLIILYFYQGWRVASKGSFSSDQALAAEKLISKMNLSSLSISSTYLLEYLGDWNRIVVDYGVGEKVVLIGAIDDMGNECPYHLLEYSAKLLGCEVVQKFDYKDYLSLKELNWPNKEGFIVKFSNGDRCKIKFEDYVRLHRVITNFSSIDIWDALRNGDNLSNALENVPDEFDVWVRNKINELKSQYMEIESNSRELYERFVNEDRKEFALTVLSKVPKQLQGIVFNMYNGKDYSEGIWKIIRPVHEKPFWAKEE